MSIRNQPDFWAGVMFAGFGAAAIVFAQENELGTAARMGPAYFPTLLGICLVVLGLVCALKGYFLPAASADGAKISAFSWKILFLVLGSIVLFCLMLQPLGLFISLAVMIAVCGLASPDTRKKETLVLILLLGFICWAVFVYLIGMIIPLFPAFLNL